MSSMRNAAPRRPHRERAQPTSRSKWGLLEKHKDYSLRAADYNAKQAKLGILKQKSRDKHPDEFAFGMVNGEAGRLGRGDEKKNRLGHGVVSGLKAQDGGYLRVMGGRIRREIGRVEEEEGLARGMKMRGKGEGRVVFGEDGEPMLKRRRLSEDEDEDEEQDDDEDEEDAHALDELNLNGIQTTTTTTQTNHTSDDDSDDSPNNTTQKTRSKKHLQKQADRLAQIKANRRRRKRLQEARAAKLEVLKKRQKEILAAANALDLQRARMAKVVGGVNKNGVRFKVRERRR